MTSSKPRLPATDARPTRRGAPLVLTTLGLAVATAGIGLLAWRQADHRADRAEMDRLIAFQPTEPGRFDPAMVAELPEPARRFFAFAIQEGTPLRTVAEIEMSGRLGRGGRKDPGYQPFRATQVLALPDGFVWKVELGSGGARLSGSDSGRWLRFWLGGLVPLVRAEGEDIRRSAFGRSVAEAVFWTPAALLPGPGVAWEPVDAGTARAIVRHDGLEQPVDITVAEDGRPLRLIMPRWSDANPDGTFRVQPFGGTMSEFRSFEGFRLPTHVEAGNHFGTDAYYPFIVAEVAEIRFPGPD